MGALRDWRSAFEQLERERGNFSPHLPGEMPFMLSGTGEAPIFPPDVTVPPPTGASITEVPLPAKTAKAAPKKAAKKVQKKAPKVAKAPRRKKASAKKPARKKEAAPAPKVKASPAKAAAKARKPRTRRPAAIPADLSPPSDTAITLPPQAEPLVLAATEPLARSASPATWRKQGLADAIGYWLRHTTRRAGAKLGFARFRSSRREIDMLKAENEELRRQLDRLRSLSDAAQFRFQE